MVVVVETNPVTYFGDFHMKHFLLPVVVVVLDGLLLMLLLSLLLSLFLMLLNHLFSLPPWPA